MGWTEKHALWLEPKWKLNTYMHCHLFSEGAKVLTRKTNEHLASAMDKLAKAVTKAAKK